MNMQIKNDFIDQLRTIIPAQYVLTAAEDIAPFNEEWRGLFHGSASVVVRPDSTEQVAAIMKLCAEYKMPITPQSGNTGLVGGQVVTTQGGVLLSLSRMKKIRALDAAGFCMVAEAGLTIQEAQHEAEKINRLFPLSLASEGSCQIGGTIATNAGGMNALLYGTMRAQVMGLEVVLPNGDIWSNLKRLKKDNSGYDLKQLFIGSEGTLGIVTAAALRLFSLPAIMETAFIATSSTEGALAVFNLLQDRFPQQLSRCELVPEIGLQMVVRNIPNSRRPLETVAPWYVVVEVVAGEATDLREPLQNCLESGLEQGIILDAAIAENRQQRKDFWRLREDLSEAQRAEGGSIKLDVSVPLGDIPEFLNRAATAVEAACPSARPVPFGHLGDGNIHYDICQPLGMDKAAYMARWDDIGDQVHDIVLQLGGSIAAEHGVGTLKRDKMSKIKPAIEMALMRQIKATLDPDSLMNPGKVL